MELVEDRAGLKFESRVVRVGSKIASLFVASIIKVARINRSLFVLRGFILMNTLDRVQIYTFENDDGTH